MTTTTTSTNSRSEILPWLEASVLFGESGDRALGHILKSGGANYFIVDKFALSESARRPRFDAPRFENSRYPVIEL